MKVLGFFAGIPAYLQLFSLLLLVLGGSLVSSMFGMGIFLLFYGTGENINDYPDMLRLLQFITAVGTMLLPALLASVLYSDKVSSFLYIHKPTDFKSALLVLASIVLVTPLINLLAWVNGKMSLPEWASSIEEFIRYYEDSAEAFTEKLINGGGTCPYLSNIIVVALTAAVAEEFLFRGALTRIIERCLTNCHVIIWVVAVLFSAFHFQFYGFVPRMILGAYFGYLLLWSKSIWLPVCAHFFNNALSITLMSNEQLRDCSILTGDIDSANITVYITIVFVSTVLFCVLNCTLRNNLKNIAKEID